MIFVRMADEEDVYVGPSLFVPVKTVAEHLGDIGGVVVRVVSGCVRMLRSINRLRLESVLISVISPLPTGKKVYRTRHRTPPYTEVYFMPYYV